MLTWQFGTILGPRRLWDFELTATKKGYLALTANRNHSSLSFHQAPRAPTRILALARRELDEGFHWTAFTDTSNLDRLSPTQPQIPPRIFQNSATGHKSLGRRRLCAAVFKRDLQALCRTWDSEWCAALCSGVLHHRLNGEQESEAPGVARRVLPTTWCHIPSPHGRLRCGAKLSSTLSSDQQSQIDNKCCCSARPLPPPSFLAKCFQNQKKKVFKLFSVLNGTIRDFQRC